MNNYRDRVVNKVIIEPMYDCMDIKKYNLLI